LRQKKFCLPFGATNQITWKKNGWSRPIMFQYKFFREGGRCVEIVCAKITQLPKDH
jgi:hypothetical protein